MMSNPPRRRRREGTTAAGTTISRLNRRSRSRDENRSVRRLDDDRTSTRMGTRSRRRGTIAGFKRRRRELVEPVARDDRGACLMMMRTRMSNLDRGACILPPFAHSCSPFEAVLPRTAGTDPHPLISQQIAAHRQSPNCRSSRTCRPRPVHPSCHENPKLSDSPLSRMSKTCSVRQMLVQPRRWEE